MEMMVAASFVRPGRVGGAEQMLYNLLGGFVDRGLTNDIRLLVREPLQPVPEVASFRTERLNRLAGLHRVAYEAAATAVYRDVDGWLFPNFFAPPSARGRVVTTIHDLHYRHLPQTFRARKRAFLNAAHRSSLRVSEVVVAISATVAADIEQAYGTRWSHKVRVIPNPVSFRRLEGGADLPDALEDRRVLLCVAAQYAHKNIDTLVRAMPRIVKRHPDVTLVLAGQEPSRLVGGATAGNLTALADELGVANHVLSTGYLDDALLGALYKTATASVLPSLFEGFGIPVVEGLGFGLPVVCSDIDSLRETSLGLAQFVREPRSADAWSACICDVLESPDSFAPQPAEVARVRATYDPARIAWEYASAMGLVAQ